MGMNEDVLNEAKEELQTYLDEQLTKFEEA